MSYLYIFTVTVLAGVGPGVAMPGARPVVWPALRDPGTAACPCPDPAHCNPVTTNAKYEVFTFIVSDTNYLRYDWTRITTAVLFGKAVHNSTIMCYAHSKGVRVSYGVDFPQNQLTNVDARTAWVKTQVNFAKAMFMDGINLDYESGMGVNDTAGRQGLNDLVTELTEAFKATFKNPQVTFDTPYTPISGRHFDYVHIANTMDFILLMAYDESGSCRAAANSGFNPTIQGVKLFMSQGISAQKMVLGLPWYGYEYPCSSISKDNVCTVAPSCGGSQVVYSGILEDLLVKSTSGRLWNKASLSPFFNYKKADGSLGQVWYDDKESLSIRYKWAAQNGLRGVGMWQADCLDYSDTPAGSKQRADMWGALPVVNQPEKMYYKTTWNNIL